MSRKLRAGGRIVLTRRSEVTCIQGIERGRKMYVREGSQIDKDSAQFRDVYTTTWKALSSPTLLTSAAVHVQNAAEWDLPVCISLSFLGAAAAGLESLSARVSWARLTRCTTRSDAFSGHLEPSSKDPSSCVGNTTSRFRSHSTCP